MIVERLASFGRLVDSCYAYARVQRMVLCERGSLIMNDKAERVYILDQSLTNRCALDECCDWPIHHLTLSMNINTRHSRLAEVIVVQLSRSMEVRSS